MRICVIGSGQLGAKIAGELVLYGHRVKLTDGDSRRLDAAYARIMNDREQLRRDGLLTASQEQAVGQLYCIADLRDASHDAELIVEAIIEDLTVKQQLFTEVCGYCSETAILSTNTLTLNHEDVFQNVSKPERSLGIRFLFPVYCIPEVEITPYKATSSDTINSVRRFISHMGKIAFLRGDRPLILTEEEREIRRLEAAAAHSLRIPTMNSNGEEASGPAGSLHFSRMALAKRGSVVNQIGLQNDSSTNNNFVSSFNSGNNNSGNKNSSNDCAVCLDNQKDTVLEPCRHLVTCMACAKTLQRRRDACPVCRSPIVDVIHVFNS